MIHYVYVGHFVHENNFIQFIKGADDRPRPVVRHALESTIIQKNLKEIGIVEDIPEECGLWFDDGFFVLDRFTHSREALEFIRRLASETGCDIADLSTLTLMQPADLAPALARFGLPLIADG